jgi:hypothetical protein
MTWRASTRRLRLILSAAILAGCIAGSLAALAGWRYDPWRQRYAVPMPPRSAPARQAVLAYLRSLDAHDRATADALSTPSERATTNMWLGNTASVTHIWISSVQHFASGPAGERYSVTTTFRYRSHWWAQDDSFPDGGHVWGYSLVRSHGRWLISDDGMG